MVKSVEYIRFDRIHEHGGQTDKLTDGRIPHDGIDRAYAQHCAAKNSFKRRFQRLFLNHVCGIINVLYSFTLATQG